jgi:hypothetical protein
MIETLFVLTMYLNGAMIEYTPKDTLSKCLTSKRLAMREVNPQSVIFKCEKLKVETEIYMGAKKIVKVIND